MTSDHWTRNFPLDNDCLEVWLLCGSLTDNSSKSQVGQQADTFRTQHRRDHRDITFFEAQCLFLTVSSIALWLIGQLRSGRLCCRKTNSKWHCALCHFYIFKFFWSTSISINSRQFLGSNCYKYRNINSERKVPNQENTLSHLSATSSYHNHDSISRSL